MTKHSSYDVVVVGGGPGGSTVASFIAMGGYNVLLVERERFPRYQVGESLLPATVNGICAKLGLTHELKQANFTYKCGGTYRWGRHAEPWSFTFGPSTIVAGSMAFAYQVERMKFDLILLKNAAAKGVEVCEATGVTGLIQERDRVTGLRLKTAAGEQAVKARIVVDASGNQSVLCRHAGERVYSKFFQNVALFGYFEGGQRLPEPNSGNIFCEAFTDGWFWYIPLTPNLTSVGAVVAREHADALKEGPEEAMRYFISQTQIIKKMLGKAKHVTDGPYGEYRIRKDYSYSNTRLWVPGLVLVGDAACFIDPIFSSGVHLATYSGLLAARSINSVLKGDIPEERCFEEFEYRYRREFGNFYQFLIAFYDMDKDLDSYFWSARKILKSEENTNDAFIQIVAGTSDVGEPVFSSAREYLQGRAHAGDVFRSAYLGAMNPSDEREAKGHGDTVEFMREFRRSIMELIAQGSYTGTRVVERPLHAGGLIPSENGLGWIDPEQDNVFVRVAGNTKP